MSDLPRTVIEFLDYPGSSLCHKTVEVRINGTPVLVERDSVDIDFQARPDGEQPTTTVVTLRLLPTEIHFTRDAKE